MRFPAYVPKAVCEYIAARLDGDAWEPVGLREAYAKSKSPDREAWAREIACLERLALDKKMRDVFARLSVIEDMPGERIAAFIAAAWVAKQDYERDHNAAEAADQWARGVATAARKLGAMLKHPPPSAQELPGELFYLRDLIECTDHPPGHRRRHAWHDQRRTLLEGWEWDVAPEVSSLVDAIATAAASVNAEPTTGLVGTALGSRQYSPKTAYLRAFIAAVNERGFDGCLGAAEPEAPPNKHFAAAMAVTAAVVLAITVTNGEIRKAVEHLKRAGLLNKPKKLDPQK